MKLLILYYSMFGHVHRMAEAVADGARDVPGTEVILRRIPETLPPDVLEKVGAIESQKRISYIPVCTLADLAAADAVIFGTPTRFGNMCGQMRQFFDATGGIWKAGSLVGKVGSVFTSSATQHGGQESTILSVHTTLLHHGMIIAGLPPTPFQGRHVSMRSPAALPMVHRLLQETRGSGGPAKTSWREPGSRAGMSLRSHQSSNSNLLFFENIFFNKMLLTGNKKI